LALLARSERESLVLFPHDDQLRHVQSSLRTSRSRSATEMARLKQHIPVLDDLGESVQAENVDTRIGVIARPSLVAMPGSRGRLRRRPV
jgi:hypothetical protein